MENAATSDADFVGQLERLYRKRDRAALAKLRRAVYDPAGEEAPTVFEVVGRFLPAGKGRAQTDAHLVTAALFAVYMQPFVAGQTRPAQGALRRRAFWNTMGASARLLRDRLSVGQESLDQRLTALLNSRFEDLPGRLRHLMQRLRAEQVPVDFRQLLRDLQTWPFDVRAVRRRWAEDYWQPGLAEKAEEETAEAAS